MLKFKRLDHQFVRHMPDVLSPGIFYISMEYATASHLCCCGCGEEVVTPFAPAQWKITFDGDAVSLHPSVGNWLLKCRSHYVIHEGKIMDAAPWSEDQIAAGIVQDKAARKTMFEAAAQASASWPQVSHAPAAKKGVWVRFIAWIKGV